LHAHLLHIFRHPSAIAWAEQQCAKVNERITHLDIDLIQPGGTVIGSLPVNLAAQVCGKGAAYILLAPPIAYLLGLKTQVILPVSTLVYTLRPS
jgi:putative CRISPR-associated protein (TIGR02620 family)